MIRRFIGVVLIYVSGIGIGAALVIPGNQAWSILAIPLMAVAGVLVMND